MRQRLTTWMRNAATIVNDLVDKAGTPIKASSAVALMGSPFDFSSITDDGLLTVSGGTVSQISYGRRGTFTALGITSGLIPIRAGDVVRITYSVAPTVAFIPQ